jgi:RNA polymerase sigma factor (sigma-70 family)
LSSNNLQRSTIEEAHGRLLEWFRELRAPLRRFIARRRAVARCDLDDVAQEVFLRLLRYDRAELVTDPRSYVFRIAANVSNEWSMRARQRLPHASSWLDELVDDTDISDDVERGERNADLQAALASLPPRACEVMRLHFSEGLTHAAISNRLNLTQRIVKREIVNACVRLRAVLSERPRESTILKSTAASGRWP